MRIALIDSHQIFTQALKESLLSSLADIELIKTYNSVEAFVTRDSEESFTLLITELDFGGAHNKGVKLVLPAGPNTNVIILTASRQDRFGIRKYMAQGVKAFLGKVCLFQELLDAIIQVQKGNMYLSQDIQNVLSNSIIASNLPPMTSLSLVERTILNGLYEQEPLKAIAGSLNLSMVEIKYHQKMLMKRFGVRRFAQLAELAKEFGQVQPEGTASLAGDKKKGEARGLGRKQTLRVGQN